MGLEGARRGAARNRMQHRRFHFEKAARVEKRAQVAHDRRTRFEHAPAFLVHDQIDVAAPITRLGIGNAVPFVGQRPQRLGKKHSTIRPYRQFAGLGQEQDTFDADHIADVPAF